MQGVCKQALQAGIPPHSPGEIPRLRGNDEVSFAPPRVIPFFFIRVNSCSFVGSFFAIAAGACPEVAERSPRMNTNGREYFFHAPADGYRFVRKNAALG